MTPITPGAADYTRLFGPAMPPDGAGQIGENGVWPQPMQATTGDVIRGLNPLQHLPVIGMIYRMATGDQIPAPMRVAGAGIFGGPLGMLGAAFMGILEEIIRLGPDTARPPVPAGMSVTGSEQGVQPVTPGTLTGTDYTTLATTTPEFLQSPTPTMYAQGSAAYQTTMNEFERSQMVEKGLT